MKLHQNNNHLYCASIHNNDQMHMYIKEFQVMKALKNVFTLRNRIKCIHYCNKNGKHRYVTCNLLFFEKGCNVAQNRCPGNTAFGVGH